MKIITGNSNKNLSLKISKYLKNRLVRSSIENFRMVKFMLKLMKILEVIVFLLFNLFHLQLMTI